MATRVAMANEPMRIVVVLVVVVVTQGLSKVNLKLSRSRPLSLKLYGEYEIGNPNVNSDVTLITPALPMYRLSPRCSR